MDIKNDMYTLQLSTRYFNSQDKTIDASAREVERQRNGKRFSSQNWSEEHKGLYVSLVSLTSNNIRI